MRQSDDENSNIVPIGQIEIDDTKPRQEPDYERLAILPTRNLVLFPGTTIPIGIERKQSLATVEMASDNRCPIAIVCQKEPDIENPTVDQLFQYGVILTPLWFALATK